MKHLMSVLIATMIMVSLCACGSEKPEPEVQAREETDETAAPEKEANPRKEDHPAYAEENSPEEEINCWGDSMTEGYGSEGLTYPQMLERFTGIPVKNLGVGGEDTREIMHRCSDYGSQEEDILVIWMGDNEGWRDYAELIRQIEVMVKKAGSERYIVITSTDDPDDFDQVWGYTHEEIGLDDTEYEAEFKKAFGDHVFIGRQYLLKHGLEINELEMTEEDVQRAKKGDISLQLRNPEIDNTHLNEAGYRAVAQGVYEKGQELGYW